MNKPFTIKLSDEHRAMLERYRKREGLRSEADAIRHLIDESTTGKEYYVAKATPEQMVELERLSRQSHGPIVRVDAMSERGARADAAEAKEAYDVVQPVKGADGKLHMPDRRPYQKGAKK